MLHLVSFISTHSYFPSLLAFLFVCLFPKIPCTLHTGKEMLMLRGKQGLVWKPASVTLLLLLSLPFFLCLLSSPSLSLLSFCLLCPLQPPSLGYPCSFSEPVTLSEKCGRTSSTFQSCYDNQIGRIYFGDNMKKNNASRLCGLYIQLVIGDGYDCSGRDYIPLICIVWNKVIFLRSNYTICYLGIVSY